MTDESQNQGIGLPFQMLPEWREIKRLMVTRRDMVLHERGGRNQEKVCAELSEESVALEAKDPRFWKFTKRWLLGVISETRDQESKPVDGRRLNTLARLLGCSLADIGWPLASPKAEQCGARRRDPIRWHGGGYARIRYFEGRTEDMCRLDRMFGEADYVCLTGPSGIGKTAIAREYPEVSVLGFRTAVWLGGALLASLRSSLEGFVRGVGTELPKSVPMLPEEILLSAASEAAGKGLKRQQPWIVIVDGLDGSDRELVLDRVRVVFEPHLAGRNKVLLTAIKPPVSVSDTVDITGMEENAAITLLLKLRWIGAGPQSEVARLLKELPHDVRETARDICKGFGWSPDGVEIVGLNLQPGEPLSEVLTRLRQASRSLFDGTRGALHANPWFSFAEPLHDFKRRNPEAAQLVKVCALLEGGSIPRHVLEAVLIGHPFEQLRKTIRRPRGFVELADQSGIWLLVEPKGESLHMHQSKQIVVEAYLREQGEWNTFVEALVNGFALELFRPNPASFDLRTPNQCTGSLSGVPHAVRLAQHLAQGAPPTEDTARFLGGLAFHLCAQGDYDQAVGYFTHAVQLLDDVSGSPSEVRCTIVHESVHALWGTGRIAEAVRVQERCLAEALRLGNALPLFLSRCYDQYAHSFVLLGRLDEALKQNNKAVHILERSGNTSSVAFAFALSEKARIGSMLATHGVRPRCEVASHERAEAECRRSLCVMEQAVRDEKLGHNFLLSSILHRLSEILIRKGDALRKMRGKEQEASVCYSDAIIEAERAEHEFDMAGLHNHPYYAMFVREHERAIRALNGPAAALLFLQEAVEKRKNVGGATSMVRQLEEELARIRAA